MSSSEGYHWSVFLVGAMFLALSIFVFYGSFNLFKSGKDSFLPAMLGMLVAALLFSIGVGGIFQNEAMTNLTYTFLSSDDTPPSALTTSWGAAGYADANTYPSGTVKKFDGRRTLGGFPFIGTLLPTSVTGATSSPAFASMNPLLPSSGPASPSAVQSTATASPAQAMNLGGITAGTGTSQAVPFSPRPTATV